MGSQAIGSVTALDAERGQEVDRRLDVALRTAADLALHRQVTVVANGAQRLQVARETNLALAQRHLSPTVISAADGAPGV